MSEKNMGRKFKVGDKVKFTEKAIDFDVFHSRIKTGDVATIVELEKGLLGDYPSKIVVESLQGELQFIEEEFEGIEEWFVKNSKKKRKHFRMGDFVKLKDSACLEEDSIFGDITHSAIGVVCGMGYDGAVEVHLTTETGYNFDRVHPKALRLANKEERKTLRKLKVAKITYNDLATEEIEQDTETLETKTPPEYDVKAGDVVKVTLDVNGHPIGTISEVVLVREDSGDYYNSVKVRDNKGILSDF